MPMKRVVLEIQRTPLTNKFSTQTSGILSPWWHSKSLKRQSRGWHIEDQQRCTSIQWISSHSVHTPSEPWPLDTFGGDPGYTTRPVLYYEDGHVTTQYSRRNFTGYGKQERTPHIPPITEAQAEALDAVHFLAEKYSLGLNSQKGDITISTVWVYCMLEMRSKMASSIR